MAKSTGKDVTLHQTILSELEGRIVSGEWPPGFRLPFEVNLAEQYNCSRMTVNKVMTQLAKAGLIERHRKTGSFVTMPQSQSAVLKIHDVEAEVRSLHLPYAYRLLSRADRLADKDDRRALEIGKDSAVVELLAIHLAGDTPFCVEERLINASAVAEASTADFEGIAPGQWLRAQVPWSTAEHRIQAVPASAATARLLQQRKGTACLVIERRTWSPAGPITFVRLTYPGDRHSLIARFTPAQG